MSVSGPALIVLGWIAFAVGVMLILGLIGMIRSAVSNGVPVSYRLVYTALLLTSSLVAVLVGQVSVASLLWLVPACGIIGQVADLYPNSPLGILRVPGRLFLLICVLDMYPGAKGPKGVEEWAGNKVTKQFSLSLLDPSGKVIGSIHPGPHCLHFIRSGSLDVVCTAKYDGTIVDQKAQIIGRYCAGHGEPRDGIVTDQTGRDIGRVSEAHWVTTTKQEGYGYSEQDVFSVDGTLVGKIVPKFTENNSNSPRNAVVAGGGCMLLHWSKS